MLSFIDYLAGWICLFFILVGCGFFTKRAFHFKNLTLDDGLGSFWVGCAAAIFILQIWHLFFPVNTASFFVVAAVGVLGLFWEHIFLASCLCHAYRGLARYPHYYVSFAIVTLWLINHAMIPLGVYDNGLYYIPTIHWLQTYPIVPGLGNLHGRLASNNSIFLFTAMVDHVFPLSTEFKFNGLLFWVFMLQFFLAAFKLFRKDGSFNVRDKFIALSSPFLLYSFTFRFVWGDYSPDFSILVLGVILSSHLLLFLENLKSENSGVPGEVFFIITLAVLGITIKLSFAVLGCFYVFLTGGAWLFYKKRPWTSADTFTCLKTCLMALLGMAPWMIRGVILTGYPAFPLTIGAFPVDWRIPRASLIQTSDGIKGYARIYRDTWSQYVNNWDWLVPWSLRVCRVWRFEIVGCLALLFAGISIGLNRRIVDKKPLHISWPVLWFIILVFFSCLAWFISAPDFRFGEINILVLSVTIFALGIRYSLNPSRIIILYLAYFLCAGFAINADRYRQGFIFASMYQHDFHRTLSTKCDNKITRSGLIVYVPPVKNQCWDEPLPCTPYPHADLCLRDARSMARGFKISPFNENDGTVGFWSK